MIPDPIQALAALDGVFPKEASEMLLKTDDMNEPLHVQLLALRREDGASISSALNRIVEAIGMSSTPIFFTFLGNWSNEEIETTLQLCYGTTSLAMVAFRTSPDADFVVHDAEPSLGFKTKDFITSRELQESRMPVNA